MTSVITDVDRAAAKTATMGVVAIRRDAIAVVSVRGTIAGHGLITSGVEKGPATAKDAQGLRLGIIDDDDDLCSRRHTPFNGWLSPKMQGIFGQTKILMQGMLYHLHLMHE